MTKHQEATTSSHLDLADEVEALRSIVRHIASDGVVWAIGGPVTVLGTQWLALTEMGNDRQIEAVRRALG